jgi:hypothetical protein
VKLGLEDRPDRASVRREVLQFWSPYFARGLDEVWGNLNEVLFSGDTSHSMISSQYSP